MNISSTPVIDPVLFNHEFQLFKHHVLDKSGLAFVTFNSNPYTEKEEGYKYEIQRRGRTELNFGVWTIESIGQGKIARSVMRAIELPHNNLVRWQAKYGPEKIPHQALIQAVESSKRLPDFEEVLFRLYRTNEDKEIFANLLALLGQKYPLIAYLYFLKDRSRYMPIAPNYFDRSFKKLGADFVTTRRCSWENYTTFNGLLAELRSMLAQALSNEVSLLDSHSFAWMLSCQMGQLDRTDSAKYRELPQRTKEAIIQARIGQGPFRKDLLDYWASCSVTGCTEQKLLQASHIKPWSDCQATEHIDVYNGLLLVPSLHAALDAGFISFSDNGQLVVSENLTAANAKALGIDATMKLRYADPRHYPYLDYHRENVFNKVNIKTGSGHGSENNRDCDDFQRHVEE